MKPAKLKSFVQGIIKKIFSPSWRVCISKILFVRKKIKGVGNKVHLESMCMNLEIDIDGDDNTISIMSGCRVDGLRIVVRGSQTSLYIGEGVSFVNGPFNNGRAFLWIEDDSTSINIGDHCSFYGNVHLAASEGEDISIGNGCMIAESVQIRNGDSHAILTDAIRTNHAKSVLISDNVWIGEGALLLKGAFIAPDSVVAARSVVTKSFEIHGSIIAGNPARMVRSGVFWSAGRC